MVAVEEEYMLEKTSTQAANGASSGEAIQRANGLKKLKKEPYIGFEGEMRSGDGPNRPSQEEILERYYEPKSRLEEMLMGSPARGVMPPKGWNSQLQRMELPAVSEELPKVELPPGKGVEVEFVTGTGSQTVSFVRRPIGLTFELTSSRPVAVKTVTVGGHAEELGVQSGWTFKTIDRTDCSLMDQTMVIGSMRDATKDLQGCLEVEFKTADGQVVRRNFTQMPLDMKFTIVKPFSVTSVSPGGNAYKLGVRDNWVITKVGGTLVADMEGAEFTAHFRSQVASLLQRGL